jgi:hypothetical protein
VIARLPPSIVEEVVGRVEVGAVVRGNLEALQGPALAARQIRDRRAGEEGDHVGGRGTVVDVLDLGPMTRRIGGDVGLEGDREINNATRHAKSPEDQWPTSPVARLEMRDRSPG